MNRKARLQLRNQNVRKLFNELSEKNPKWRMDAIIEEVAKRMFLSERTVEAILKFEGIYNDTTTQPLPLNQLKLNF